MGELGPSLQRRSNQQTWLTARVSEVRSETDLTNLDERLGNDGRQTLVDTVALLDHGADEISLVAKSVEEQERIHGITVLIEESRQNIRLSKEQDDAFMSSRDLTELGLDRRATHLDNRQMLRRLLCIEPAQFQFDSFHLALEHGRLKFQVQIEHRLRLRSE